MKRFVEVLPAAILLLLFGAIATLQLLGFTWVESVAQAVLGITSWAAGLIVLGLCILGPLIWAVLYLSTRVRGRR
jgi:apolipoprotein N-acyltransferase